MKKTKIICPFKARDKETKKKKKYFTERNIMRERQKDRKYLQYFKNFTSRTGQHNY